MEMECMQACSSLVLHAHDGTSLSEECVMRRVLACLVGSARRELSSQYPRATVHAYKYAINHSPSRRQSNNQTKARHSAGGRRFAYLAGSLLLSSPSSIP